MYNKKEYQEKYNKTPQGIMVRKMAQRKYRQSEKGKLSLAMSQRNYNINNQTKRKVTERINTLVRSGNIKNSEFECAICGKQPVDFHHENYELWWSFIPLCKQHHGDLKKNT